VSGWQIEQIVDELILFTNILAADPPRLPLPDPGSSRSKIGCHPQRPLTAAGSIACTMAYCKILLVGRS
jgi:hypothetical protein